MSRSSRAELARETIAIMRAGRYKTRDGATVSVRDEMRNAVAGSRVFTPDQLPADTTPRTPIGTRTPVTVTRETTLDAARRIGGDVAVLNFASAKNPGGGFQNGSQAQEESLARSSGLYECLLAGSAYYDANRHGPRGYYTDHVIYAPSVPVFRDDEGMLLAEPYFVSMVTAPAVNAGALATPDRTRIRQTMATRIEHALSVFRHYKHDHIVLGAWGCGVFRNDPEMIAELFEQALHTWRAEFATVTFAIPGKTDDRNRRAFLGRFAEAR